MFRKRALPWVDGENGSNKKKKIKHDKLCSKIHGKIVLMKKKVLDVNSIIPSVIDRFDELIGHGVTLQLISSDHGDLEKGGKLSKPAKVKDWLKKITSLTEDGIEFKITFDLDEGFGLPGAFIIKNNHHFEFYLMTVTLEDVLGQDSVHFVCNSWVYPVKKYNYDRVFFSNTTYLPSETPMALHKYREEELVNLRGNGKGKLRVWDRVYDYANYNDLGDPDKGTKYARPVLGGSAEFPYPRRGRTGRPPTKTDPKSESRLRPIKFIEIYVPRDERFSDLKMSDAVAYGLKSLYQFLFPEVKDFLFPEAKGQFGKVVNEFNSLDQVIDLYEGGIKIPAVPFLDKIKHLIPTETLKELMRSDGEELMKFPVPHVIEVDKSAWRSDEEFGREMLAGINPVVIRRLEEFPPKSKLDPSTYGNQKSSITIDHIKSNLNGLTIEEAIKNNRMFILDHHDDLMPFIRRINETSTKTYASRTLLFLKDDDTLKPIAIELSLPHHKGDKFGAVSKVYTPAKTGVDKHIWDLAKAYVAVNDSGTHQLISHWLKTHAAIEPFIIATNRQLSVIHPVYKLLHPHFRDTMNVNALAREILINAGGALQFTLFTERYSMELSSAVYKNWVFPEQALPADLIKRGMAMEDPESPHRIRLTIEDYPYAVDGLKIWSAIKTWVRDYISFYYKNDDQKIQDDTELQSWWHELRTVGHGDKRDAPWWPTMDTHKSLIETCTTIIWLASAFHAAVNFGQYPYGGYLPNRPSISRKLMPKPCDYKNLEKNPERAFLETITAKHQTLLGISLIEVLSRHTSDEVYLGQRDTPEWTDDVAALQAFDRFGKKLQEIEEEIKEMNGDEKLKNRTGPVKMPYTLLIPSSEVGLTGKGIPNSVSI